VKLVILPVTFVVERDDDAAVQECELAETLGEGVEAEHGGLKDLRIGLEGDLGATSLGGAGHLELGRGNSAFVRLRVHLAVAPDLEVERLR
jgi:hypothetical protein